MSIATKNIFVVAVKSPDPVEGLPEDVLKFCRGVQDLLPEFEVRVNVACSPRIAHGINMVIDEFMLDGRNEWLLFWDRRVLISPEQVRLMVEAKMAVIGALYPSQEEEPKWQAQFFPDMKADGRGVLPVPELEDGAKLYHRTAFLQIEQTVPDLAYIFDQSGRSVRAFAQEALVQFSDYKRMLSPAWFLDYLCRLSGLGIHAHVGCLAGWNGTKGVVPPDVYRPWEHTRKPAPPIAELLPEGPEDSRPILVLIQYCDKDKSGAERLREHIRHWGGSAELFYSPGAKYPSGPNETALRILRANYDGFKAVLMIEPDCVPVNPDWLKQLSHAWDRAQSAGKLIMGSWHPINLDHPTLGHLNGNLMFSPSLASIVTIPDVPPKKPWDTFLADVFEPYWCRTGLIKNLNRHRTATLKQLTTPECGDRPPVLVHGVRDESSWDLAKRNASCPRE